MVIAGTMARWWHSFFAMLLGEEALEAVTETAYFKLRQAYIRRAKRGNTALVEMIVEPPSSTCCDKTAGYERELRAIMASLRSSEFSAWIKEQRKLRVLLLPAEGSSFATVQLAVARRIRRVFAPHLGLLFPTYPTISFLVLHRGEETSCVTAPSSRGASTSPYFSTTRV